jgi:hypothetical protein
MSADEYEGLPGTFAALCRAADAKQRKKPRNPDVERLRVLLPREVTISRADAEIRAHHFRGRASDWTVEALVYALRDGLGVLKDSSNQRRLRELNDKQMKDVAARVQQFMPHIAPAWKADDVQALLSLWSKLR